MHDCKCLVSKSSSKVNTRAVFSNLMTFLVGKIGYKDKNYYRLVPIQPAMIVLPRSGGLKLCCFFLSSIKA